MKLSDVDIDTIEYFLNHYPLRNSWLYLFNSRFELYARRGRHQWNGKAYHTFDVANMQIPIEDERGGGRLTALLTYLEQHYNVYVESIENPRLEPYLRARGYEIRQQATGIQVWDAFKANNTLFQWTD